MTELFQAIHRIGQTDPNKCGDCAHPFHGLPCTIVHCQCPTAFHDKYELEETA